jgi:aminoglycoside phosphotransferase (APT) family kinase protein
MGADEHSHTRTEGHVFATSLGPALIEHCNGRLSPIEWFRSTWQHGGAATGFARWTNDDGSATDVFVKLPVGPVEFRWTSQLSAHDAATPTPRVIAGGSTLGGYDLAWVIVERLDGHTLSHHWCKESLEHLLAAAAHLQARAAAATPVAAAPPSPDWSRLIARAREVARTSELPEAQHWNEVEKRVQKVLPRLASKWAARPIDAWCHGDLHPSNAMRRPATNASVLIDLALVHAGSWVEDAVYLERQFWGRPDQLFDVHPVSLLARYRRELGLRTEGDYGQLANIRRVLMAASAPVYLAREGHPRYLHAALETIDRLLPQVSR